MSSKTSACVARRGGVDGRSGLHRSNTSCLILGGGVSKTSIIALVLRRVGVCGRSDEGGVSKITIGELWPGFTGRERGVWGSGAADGLGLDGAPLNANKSKPCSRLSSASCTIGGTTGCLVAVAVDALNGGRGAPEAKLEAAEAESEPATVDGGTTSAKIWG